MSLRDFMIANSILTDRVALGSLGSQYGGKRDTYEAAGYDKAITPDQYALRYLRQDIAGRIVDIYPEETWRKPPEIRDTESADLSQFERAWQYLVDTSDSGDGETQRGLFHYIVRADKLAGLGRYAVILLGINDGQALDQPVETKARKPEDLIYVNVFDEASARVAEWDTDATSQRFGKPLSYNLSFRIGEGEIVRKVHWTRCIHIAESPLRDDQIGRPRLELVFNRLMDLEKILAASGEGAWRVLVPSYVMATKDGYRLPAINPAAPEDVQAVERAAIEEQEAQLDELVHGLRRWLQLEGMEPHPLPADIQDPSAAVNVVLQMIAAAMRIPLRVLIGSERGELASSQDERSWARTIQGRQSQFAEPVIMRPLINRLIWLGILPVPANGRYEIIWPDLLEKERKEEAEIADKVASALQKLGIQVDAQAFVDTYLPDIPLHAVTNGIPAPSVPASSPERGGEPAANAGFFRRFENYP